MGNLLADFYKHRSVALIVAAVLPVTREQKKADLDGFVLDLDIRTCSWPV